MTLPAAYSSFAVAAAQEPLSTASSNTLLQDSDPALFHALAYWTFILNTYAGPRLVQACAGANLTTQNGPITQAVAQAYPYEPQQEYLETQLQFPLLAVYRTATEYNKYTIGWYDDKCAFDLLYVLPPMLAGQTEQIRPILRAAEREIRYKTIQTFDPGYTPPGGTLGQSPWGLAFAGIEEIGWERGNHGFLESTGNLLFPCLRMQGWFKERDMYVRTGAGTLAGVDVTGDLMGADGTRIDPFVQASVPYPPPTITGLSVMTGSHAGGTTVVITGTGFLQGGPTPPGPPNVTFAATAAATFAWQSATQITVTTPAMLPGTYSLTLVNADGQTLTTAAPLQFTFA
jgi:IPT/TIG domain-containing protein